MSIANDPAPEFIWGVSSAAYQTEGAWNTDGKGASIWDIFSKTKGKISGGGNGDLACDFYHRYAQDIALMSQLQIPNFRFSRQEVGFYRAFAMAFAIRCASMPISRIMPVGDR